MLLSIYDLLMRAAQPLLLRKLRRRAQKEPAYLHATHQRFARYTTAELSAARMHAGQWVWVHAVSLGEMRAAAIVLREMRAYNPGMQLLLTQGTATGWQEGRKLLREGDLQFWLPWDTRTATRHFIDAFRPRIGLLMETEMWPNLLQACQQAGVPVALVNARVNDKTLRQSLRLRALAARAYGSLRVAYAQTPRDADALRQLGAGAVVVTGNLKFDAAPDATLLAQGQSWRQQLQGHEARPVAMLASSREGEEQLWLQALRSLASDARHALQWLVVPRHPQRFDEVAALLQQAGWAVLRRSQWPQHGLDASGQAHGQGVVWLGDSLGEMPLYYGMADVVLMGGSYAPLGGQNLIEACACGCPVLLGPHTFNFAEASEEAIKDGAALRCADMLQAVQQALALCSCPAQQGGLQAMQQAAAAFSTRRTGIAQAIVHDLATRTLLQRP